MIQCQSCLMGSERNYTDKSTDVKQSLKLNVCSVANKRHFSDVASNIIAYKSGVHGRTVQFDQAVPMI